MLRFQVRGARVPTPARPPRSPRRPGSGGSGLGGCARVFLVRLHGADAAVYGLLAAAWACGFAGGAFMVQWRWVFGHGLCGRGRRRVRLRGRQVHHAVSPHVVACMSSSGPTETEQGMERGKVLILNPEFLMASVSGFVLITSIYEIYCAIPHVT